MIELSTITLSGTEFKKLRDYSSSLPTGTTIGKRWKRRKNYYDEDKGWLMGEYVEHDGPNLIGIKWHEIEIELTAAEERDVVIDELTNYLQKKGLSLRYICFELPLSGFKITVIKRWNQNGAEKIFNLYDPQAFEQIAEYLDCVE